MSDEVRRAVRTVAVTGATGIVGTAIRKYLSNRYDLRLITRRQEAFSSTIANIQDVRSLVAAFEGTQAVVHLAAAATVEASWPEVLSVNIIGTYNVFEAARSANVDCVIFASSNHVVGMNEVDNAPQLYELDNELVWDAKAEVRPDSLYGVSKVFGEALGRYYVDNYGLRVICLRIGSVLAGDDPRSDDVVKGSAWLKLTPEQALARLRATWMSQRDCAELISKSLEATGVNWAVVYGVSNNPRRFWDLRSASDLVGFVPQDAAPI
jgi:nucleoside-diphosphate-sugar epimerase